MSLIGSPQKKAKSSNLSQFKINFYGQRNLKQNFYDSLPETKNDAKPKPSADENLNVSSTNMNLMNQTLNLSFNENIPNAPQNTPLVGSSNLASIFNNKKVYNKLAELKQENTEVTDGSNKENRNQNQNTIYGRFTKKSKDLKTGKYKRSLSPFLIESKPLQVIDCGRDSLAGKTGSGKLCKECGMVFNRQYPADRDAHRIYHAQAVEITRFNSISSNGNFRKLMDESEGAVQVVENLVSLGHRVVQITNKMTTIKSTTLLKKFSFDFENLRKFIDKEMGTEQESLQNSETIKPYERAYLYLNEDDICVGYLLVELISNSPSNTHYRQQIIRKQSLTSVKNAQYFLGVKMIWTHKPFRRHKIGTELLDTARNRFHKSHQFGVEDICFSDVNFEGGEFAKSYCGDEDFLIYRFE